MYLPKHDVYTALSSITDVTVQQASQKAITDVPAITFFVSDNNESVDLSNETASQNIEVTVDIWASNSSNADDLLSQAHTKMKGLGYVLSYCTDVPDPQDICHINTRFTGLITKGN